MMAPRMVVNGLWEKRVTRGNLNPEKFVVKSPRLATAGKTETTEAP